MMKSKLNNRIVILVSFFLFSGYYVGLSLIFAGDFSSLSQYYSIPLRVLLCIIMVIFLKNNVFKIKRESSSYLLLLLFSFLYIIKVLYTENILWVTRNPWYYTIFYYLSYCVLPFLFFSVVDIRVYKKQIINALIFSGFLLAITSIYIFKDLILSGSIGRIGKTSEGDESVISPLALAYSSVITLSLCFYKLIYEKPLLRQKIYLIAVIILSIVLFVIGSTRGAVVALFLGVLVLIYFGNVKRKILSIFLIIISIPVVIWGIEFTGSSILSRTTQAIEEGDTGGRNGLWIRAFNEFLDNPTFGGRIEVSGIYPHNIFLEIMMATGLVGLVIFLVFMLQLVFKGFRLVRHNNVYIIPILLFICGISLHNFSGSIYTAITVFSSLGLLNYKVNNE